MPITGWTLDLAREQSPSISRLSELVGASRGAGYDALGLYLEHRFAYRSAPWAGGPGCLAPAGVAAIRHAAQAAEGGGIRVIPFLNTLGHMEGFIRARGGEWLAERAGAGSLQMCPSRPECVAFARDLVRDALESFSDEWVHVGGDETRQLGMCPLCAERAAGIGGVGGLYADYFSSLCRWLLAQGRRPCLWGDMLLRHPEALERLPKETLIFDWQYFQRPRESTALLRSRGFDVVCCPSIQSYNSGWCFLDATTEIIDAHAEDAAALGALGVFVTTWEFSYFTQFAGYLPLVLAAGRRVARGDPWQRAIRECGGERYARAAELLGNELPRAAEFLRRGTWRQMRDALVIRQNPFQLWLRWRDEACGPAGDAILGVCARAARELPDGPPRAALAFAIELHAVAVDWVRLVERAATAYAEQRLETALTELHCGADLLERLRPGLRAAAQEGGSTADIRRLDRLLEKCAAVVGRLRELDPSGPYWPSFATLVHDGYVAGDQAGWRAADPVEPRRSEVG